MRIARILIAWLTVACWGAAAVGQQPLGYGGYTPAAMAGYGPGAYAGYQMQPAGGYYSPYAAQGYGPQAMAYGYGQPTYGMPVAQQPMPGYSAMPNMVPAGYQPQAGLQQAGPPVAGAQPGGAAVQDTAGLQPDVAAQMAGEPCAAPVMMPQQNGAFTWNPPPGGSCMLSGIGGPYQALQNGDGCTPGMLGGWGQAVRSRIGQPYIRAEAIMWRRHNGPSSQPLFVSNLALPNQATVMTTGNLPFSNEVGQRMTIGMAFSERSAFEVTYLALQNWVSTDTVFGSNLFLAGDLATAGTQANAFSFANQVSATAATMLQSLEFNYIATTVFEKFSLMGGFRYFDLKDALDLVSVSNTNGFGTFPIHTLNQLYGGQLGVLFRQNVDLLTFELTTKAGVYDNHATQTQVLTTTNLAGTTQVPRAGSGAQNTSAFVGDIGISGVYHFSNWLAVRAGYNVMFIDNVALAPGQINFSQATSNNNINGAGNGINHDSDLFIYGANLGLDARF